MNRPATPTDPAAASREDLDQLRLLSIFHYVVAGMMALFSLFPIFHLLIGLGMLTGSLPDTQGDEAARFVGGFFVVFALAWIVFGLISAALVALAGVYLKQQRKYTYCLVVAALSCLFMPFGTVLGVFTIIVLMRDSVKRLFGRPPAAPAAPD